MLLRVCRGPCWSHYRRWQQGESKSYLYTPWCIICIILRHPMIVSPNPQFTVYDIIYIYTYIVGRSPNLKSWQYTYSFSGGASATSYRPSPLGPPLRDCCGSRLGLSNLDLFLCLKTALLSAILKLRKMEFHKKWTSKGALSIIILYPNEALHHT